VPPARRGGRRTYLSELGSRVTSRTTSASHATFPVWPSLMPTYVRLARDSCHPGVLPGPPDTHHAERHYARRGM
jgi:hypothetical protein